MEKIKLPRSSYEEIARIIISYGKSQEPSTLDELAQIYGGSKTQISANNAFLSYVGIIEGTQKKGATEIGQRLAKSLEFDIEDDISGNWRQIVDENDFLSKMVSAVEIRKEMEISQLENHIAFSASEENSKHVMTGARAVIDILLASKLVDESNGLVFPTNQEARKAKNQISSREYAISSETVNITEALPRQDDRYPTNIVINLNIAVAPNELDELADQLNDFVAKLKIGKGNSAEDNLEE